MYYYFSARFSAVLKIDGVFIGKIDKCVKKVELSSCDAFIEVCPLELGIFPLAFLLDKGFLTSPPNGVSVVDLKGGYLIEFNFLQDNTPFTILSQEKLPHAVITVFKENGLKVSIESPNDFFAENIPFYCKTAKITPFVLDNKRLVAIQFDGEEKLLNCYLLENNIQKVFSRVICEFSLANGFSTAENFLDIAKHSLTYFWSFQGEKLVKNQTSLSKTDDFCISSLPEHLIGYAFLEEFLCGGDVSDYLADNVMQNKDFLVDYFGNFIGVMPPPDFRKFDEIGLIYKCDENKYRVEYFAFELRDRKICNIIKAN